MKFESVNPASGERLASFDQIDNSQLTSAITRANDAYHIWRQETFANRRAALRRLAESLRRRSDEYASLITAEMGKRFVESRYEIEFCAKIADFYAANGEAFLADQSMTHVDATAMIRHDPIGVLLGVMPWNFPFYQVARFAVPNLMTGNVVLIKHAMNVPQCAVALADLMSECGLPDGVYTNLFASHAMVETVIADPRVQGVSLTGSERAGSAVAALAGKHLKRSVLELGGNDAFIVLEDADIKEAVKQAVRGRTVNAGQSCVAAKRMIVVRSVADEFIDQFTSAMLALRVGDPMEPSTTLGPLSSKAAAERLTRQVNAGAAAGAKVVIGGNRVDGTGAFFQPTILMDVTPDMPIFDQELFGPVATIHVVDDQNEAIRLANQSSYGLGGSVHTQNIDRGRQVAAQMESGMVFVNKTTTSQVELPFGGIKNSGYGREMSDLGILEFVNRKLVHLGD